MKVIVILPLEGGSIISLLFSVEEPTVLQSEGPVCLKDVGECLSQPTHEELLSREGILEYFYTYNEGDKDEIRVYKLRNG